jgi:hypothetical protein
MRTHYLLFGVLSALLRVRNLILSTRMQHYYCTNIRYPGPLSWCYVAFISGAISYQGIFVHVESGMGVRGAAPFLHLPGPAAQHDLHRRHLSGTLLVLVVP